MRGHSLSPWGLGLFLVLMAAPGDLLGQTQEQAVELLPLCIRSDGKSIFATEELAKANCLAGFGKYSLPGCSPVWQCKAAKANHSKEFRTKEEAQANCSNGVVRGIVYPGWYWICDPLPAGTSAAKDIFQGQSGDIQKEYDRMIDKLYSGQKDAVKLPAKNPFKKAGDAQKLPPAPASAARDPSKRSERGGKPPIVCPPNPAGCITVKELGKSSEQLASKFLQSCPGVQISFKWQSCGKVCIEHSEHMSEGESFINYTNRTYPTAYDVTCSPQ